MNLHARRRVQNPVFVGWAKGQIFKRSKIKRFNFQNVQFSKSKAEAKKIKSNDLTVSNREKFTIAITIWFDITKIILYFGYTNIYFVDYMYIILSNIWHGPNDFFSQSSVLSPGGGIFLLSKLYCYLESTKLANIRIGEN